MHMAVPETGGHDQARAVNNRRMARNFDCGGWPDSNNAALVNEDCTIFDWRFSRRGINLCVNQGEVRAETRYARSECPDKKDRGDTSDSHASNIRQEARDCSRSLLQNDVPEKQVRSG